MENQQRVSTLFSAVFPVRSGGKHSRSKCSGMCLGGEWTGRCADSNFPIRQGGYPSMTAPANMLLTATPDPCQNSSTQVCTTTTIYPRFPPRPPPPRPHPMASPTPAKKRKGALTAVADFAILPLTLPTQPGLPPLCADAKHYLYVKAHAPAIATESTARSLFVANVPIDASEANLRALFAEQLGGARVESVGFDASVPAEVAHKHFNPAEVKGGKSDGAESRGKKRKREEDGKGKKSDMVAEGVLEDEDSALPRTWSAPVRRSGSGAVVVFLDKASMRGALKEVHAAIKSGKAIHWVGGEALGVGRTSTYWRLQLEEDINRHPGYTSHLALLHPPPTLLSATTNAYLSQFDAAAAQRARALAHLRSVPDEDGFITVTRGGGRSLPAARLEIAQQKQSEQEDRKKKKGSLDGFYRFQNREKRKEQEGMLKKQFEKDRRRVMEMRERRGKVRVES